MPIAIWLRSRSRPCLLALVAAWITPGAVFAQQCEAYFPFDNSLADTSGSGHDGEMIDKEGGSPAPNFVAGYNGQALALSGDTAMRAFIDLHPERCPQITISAWLHVDPAVRGTRVLVGTGNAQSPGMRVDRGTLTANGPANGLSQQDVFRTQGGWTFVAVVYDFTAGVYSINWRTRQESKELNDRWRPPEDALWVGALNDALAQQNEGILIDDLRITGRALTAEQLRALQSGRATPASSTATNVATPVWQGAACDQSADCGPGNYCGFDNQCHPDRHAPKRDIELPLYEGQSDNTGFIISDSGQSDDEIALLDDPRALPVTPDSALTPPAGQPADQLQDNLETAQNSRPDHYIETYDNEVYRIGAVGPERTMNIVLPGSDTAETVTYMEIDGLAIAEGDIILGTLDELDSWRTSVDEEVSSTDGSRTRRQGLLARKNTKYLWPGGRIPYEFHSNVPDNVRATAESAILTLSSATNLDIVPKNSSHDNWVEFKLKDRDDDSCSSRVGKKQGNGGQTIKLDPACGETTIMHELLHAAGFWHEQSRPDRDQYVEILWDNIDHAKSNFKAKSGNEAIELGNYNYRSIMHYGEYSFGKECIKVGTHEEGDDCAPMTGGGFKLRTIRATQPSAVISRDESLASDIDAINLMYPGSLSPLRGENWGNTHYATAAAIGDVDGDGRNELVIGRSASSGSRFIIYDDAAYDHRVLASGPSDWGADVSVTGIAVGDLNGDGVAEIGVTRRSNSANRFYIFERDGNGVRQIFAGGQDWGAGNYATAIAFGDIDGDGRNEVAIGRRAGEFGRYYIYDDGAATEPFKRLDIGGSNWAADAWTTALAFGDIDNDGRAELGITRRAVSGFRYEVIAWNGSIVQKHAGGHDWDSTHYGTAIGFGNIDADPGDEIIVGRHAASGSRFHLIDDASGSFQLIDKGGDGWGNGNYTTGVAIADVDRDGLGELIVARRAGSFSRYYVRDDALRNFAQIPVVGDTLPGGVGATGVAAGDLNDSGAADFVVTFDADRQGFSRFEIMYIQ